MNTSVVLAQVSRDLCVVNQAMPMKKRRDRAQSGHGHQLLDSNMRSDAKLGLALGMLVIGFAVAFCFPRPGRKSHLAELRKPTLSVNEPDLEFVQLQSLREEGSQLAHSGPSPRLNQLPQREHPAVNPTEAGNASSPPNSESEVSSQSGLSDILFSDNMPSAKGTESFTPVLPEKVDIAESESKMSTYRVQANDTLSEIAMRTLGSYSRYLDIYAANRDQLSSPDDLRLGMELKIPTWSEREEENLTDNLESSKNLSEQGELNLESHSPQRFHGTQGAPFLSDQRTEVPVHQIQPSKVSSHVIRSGDTLERIALRYFGTTKAVAQIRKANPELTRNPQRLRPGVILQLVP